MFIHGDDDYDMGHTVAGWTGMGITSLGFGLCGLGVIAASGRLLLAGAAVLILALLATWMLHLAGWGKPSGPRPAAQWDWRVRDLSARNGHTDCLGCRLAGRRATHRQAGARPVEPALADA
ncbi:HGxxPAAW family protein [Streptomyces sp. NBC_01334]|uniref:HGxxPAAW family protein n=1 Tax=Streptomyces sp. NBC_01334 TaxID=2903827 RepID=UPI002E12455E|nr:HGxxPAAW family protein [Streptomyces sp. NBC_01334]